MIFERDSLTGRLPVITRTLIALFALSAASAASAQWVPGSEIAGQRVEVETNGILNTVYFEVGGVAQISSPSGAKVVTASWTARGGKLCLTTDRTFDCYAYQKPFTARYPVTLVSDCGVVSRWVALTTYIAPFERG
jgi:hypothetical protein